MSRGYSLLEIMIALAIAALIVGVVSTSLYDVWQNAQIDVARIQVKQIDQAVEFHRLQHRAYPTSLTAVSFDNDKPVPPDPWQRPYDYVAPGRHNARRFDVSSAGPDKVADSADDIGNWQ